MKIGFYKNIDIILIVGWTSRSMFLPLDAEYV